MCPDQEREIFNKLEAATTMKPPKHQQSTFDLLKIIDTMQAPPVIPGNTALPAVGRLPRPRPYPAPCLPRPRPCPAPCLPRPAPPPAATASAPLPRPPPPPPVIPGLIGPPPPGMTVLNEQSSRELRPDQVARREAARQRRHAAVPEDRCLLLHQEEVLEDFAQSHLRPLQNNS